MGGNEADLQAHDLAARMQGRQTLIRKPRAAHTLGCAFRTGMIDPTRHHGLDIIRAVADEWGIDGDHTGRTIWARFDWPVVGLALRKDGQSEARLNFWKWRLTTRVDHSRSRFALACLGYRCGVTPCGAKWPVFSVCMTGPNGNL